MYLFHVCACYNAQAGMKVTNVMEDFKDGTKLIVLLELLTGEKVVWQHALIGTEVLHG